MERNGSSRTKLKHYAAQTVLARKKKSERKSLSPSVVIRGSDDEFLEKKLVRGTP